MMACGCKTNWRWFVGLAAVLVIAILVKEKVGGEERIAALPAGEMKTLAEGNTKFAADLYGQLRKDEKQAGKNLFFSPYSISAALAMTYGGARGETEKQMAEVLGFSLGQEKTHQGFGVMRQDLNEAGEKKGTFQLHAANRLWGQKGYGFLESFLRMTKIFYGAGLEEADFVKSAEAARQRINGWVEEQTKGKIRDIMPEGVLNKMTRLVLTNAIYFKGEWVNKFKSFNTSKKPFYTTMKKEILADMMRQKEEFGYADWNGYQILEMPYKGERVGMVIFLPRETEGLAQLEERLDGKMLEECFLALKPEEVEVRIPKFEFSCGYSLEGELIKMGMADVFEAGKADFSGMNGKKDLFVSAVLHKAYVKIDEEKTEAAAASSVAMKAADKEGQIKWFQADHPFLFLIRDRVSGTILFFGRVMNPAEKSD